MKYLLLSFLLSAPVFSFAQSFANPESAEYDAANHRWLVSQNSAGKVLAYSPSSGALATFCSGLGSGPYGIEILGNALYCCAGGWVKGYDLTSGSQVFNVNLGASFLNGITSDGNHYLFVTDFSAKKIYRVNTATNAFNVMATLVKTPNGILYDGAQNRLVYVTWGSNAQVQSLSLSDSTVTTFVTTTLSNFDGIARDCRGNWYVSSWGNNSLNKFDPTFSFAPTVVKSGLSQPADLGINATGDSIAVPNSSSTNTVSFYAVPVVPTVTPTVTNPSCFETTGSATLSVSGGMAPYHFAWSDGTTKDGLVNTAPGDYAVTVTDSLGCSRAATLTVLVPDTLRATATVTPDNPATPSCDGAIDLSLTGGTAPFYISWSNGATGTTLTGLCQGWYYASVVDVHWCALNDSVFVSGSVVTDLSNVDAANDLTLSPNPSDDRTIVTLGESLRNATVLLVDMTGRTRISKTASENSFVLERGTLPSGVYTVVAKGASGEILSTQKLVYR